MVDIKFLRSITVLLSTETLKLTHNCYQTWFVLIVGQLSRQVYEGLRREASSLLIQRHLRMYLARKAYQELYFSAVSIQTGMRGLTARNELRFRRRTRAAIIIQVKYFIEKIDHWMF